jgi:hypothetical protein
MRLTKCQRLHVDVTVVPGGDAGTRTSRAAVTVAHSDPYSSIRRPFRGRTFPATQHNGKWGTKIYLLIPTSAESADTISTQAWPDPRIRLATSIHGRVQLQKVDRHYLTPYHTYTTLSQGVDDTKETALLYPRVGSPLPLSPLTSTSKVAP